MVDITQIMRFDDLASKNSPIHNLEGRIKLISTVFIILVCVVSKELFIPIVLEIFLLIVLKHLYITIFSVLQVAIFKKLITKCNIPRYLGLKKSSTSY